MKKIIYNLSSSLATTEDPYHGGNEYAIRVAIELIESLNEEIKVFFLVKNKNLIHSILKKKIEDSKHCVEVECCSITEVQALINKEKCNLFFDPLASSFVSKLDLKHSTLITTIHGLRGMELPTEISEYHTTSKIKYIIKKITMPIYKNKIYHEYKSIFLNNAKKKIIVAVSNHTKYAIKIYFNDYLNNTDLHVFYSPEKYQPENSFIKNNNLFFSNNKINNKKYFLLLSAARWIKNSNRAIKAFINLKNKGLLKDYQVVITGVKSREKNTPNLINPTFIYLDFLEASELELLYKSSFCFVYPTLNEGFGYPPIEAMKYSIPVVSSAITSTTEVVGDAALYFNPYSVEEIENRVLQLIENEELVKELSEKSTKQYEYISKVQQNHLERLIKIIINQN